MIPIRVLVINRDDRGKRSKFADCREGGALVFHHLIGAEVQGHGVPLQPEEVDELSKMRVMQQFRHRAGDGFLANSLLRGGHLLRLRAAASLFTIRAKIMLTA